MSTSRVDISFLYNYRGVLYPIEHGSTATKAPNPVPKLVDLCSAVIVLDSSSTKRALEMVPQELCYSMMKAALVLAKDRSIEVLVAHWPWRILTLRKFAPPLFDDISALYGSAYVARKMRCGVKYTTCLAHTFVECLKKRTSTKLRYLDLTGYPTAEVIVNYLASHVLLVFNESRQREIIHMYNEVTQNLPEEQRRVYDHHSTLPEDSFVILLDAFMQTNEAHMELCRALRTANLAPCQFKLRIQRMDISSLGVPRISVLLEQIDPEHMTALGLQYNGLRYPGLVILAPALQRLTQLSALDISCNNINFTGDNNACDILESVLKSLPLLTRLDISNNRTKGHLRQILTAVAKPLRYLRIAGCGLTPADLAYFAFSHHVHELQELDLSDNRLSGQQTFSFLLALLKNASMNLVILEMEDTELEEIDLIELLKSSKCLCKLQYWNICKLQQLTEALLNEYIGNLVSMQSLKTVRLSYPVEVYSVDSDSQDIDSEKVSFSWRLTQLLTGLCERNSRDVIAVSLTT